MIKIFKTIPILLIMLILISIVANGLDVSAKGAIVLNAQTNEIVFEQNAYQRLPMASTTKIMTALLALEYGDLDQTVVVSKLAASQEGSSMYLYEGEHIALVDLIYGLMLSSGNDAAVAISEHISGSKENFIALMNQRAKELSLKDTNFLDPCGFYYKEHFTSAYDLAILSSYALKNETFAKIVSARKWQAGKLKNGNIRWVFNHNKLLSSYNGANGIKTGYTIDSGRCLVSSAQRDGILLVCVTLRCSNDWNEHKKMLDYGFSNVTKQLILKSGEKTYNIPVGGGDKSFITVTNHNDVYINTSQLNLEDVKITTNLPKMLFAPVEKNKAVGEIKIVYKDQLIESISLYPDISVNSLPIVEEKNIFENFFGFIKNLFAK